MAGVWPRRVQPFEPANETALEWPDRWRAPRHADGVYAAIVHAPIAGLRQAASVERDGGAQDGHSDGLATIELSEERAWGAVLRHATSACHGIQRECVGCERVQRHIYTSYTEKASCCPVHALVHVLVQV